MTQISELPASATAQAAPGAVRNRRARILASVLESAGVPCEIVLHDRTVIRCGEGAPTFRVTIKDESALRAGTDELALGAAYVEGKIDIEGDLLSMFDVRSRLADRTPWMARLNFLAQLLQKPTSMNKKAIGFHYTLGDDFYLSFIDSRHRFYSHGIFESETESIEEASTHKLETMYNALRLKPGMRILDIGAGWGGAMEYCARRGVKYTGLTIAEDSYRFVSGLIKEHGYDAEVHLQDFLEYRPEKPFDAIVIYGVIEHIPNYRRFCERVWECLAPGGRIYMDASASKEKFKMSAFTRRYIWHGTHTFLELQGIVQEFLLNGFKVVEVANESRDYELTMKQWAERFDAAHDKIAAKWGEELYRAFRIYLWGGCHAFHVDRLQAYHVVAERGTERGPRPGTWERAKNFVVGLR